LSFLRRMTDNMCCTYVIIIFMIKFFLLYAYTIQLNADARKYSPGRYTLYIIRTILLCKFPNILFLSVSFVLGVIPLQPHFQWQNVYLHITYYVLARYSVIIYIYYMYTTISYVHPINQTPSPMRIFEVDFTFRDSWFIVSVIAGPEKETTG